MDPSTLVVVTIGGIVAAMAIVFGAFYYGRSSYDPVIDHLKEEIEELKEELRIEREEREADNRRMLERAVGANIDAQKLRKVNEASSLSADDRLARGLLLAGEAAADNEGGEATITS